MTQRINKSSQKRIDKALDSVYTMRSSESNKGLEDRAEALSRVYFKKVK